MIPAELVPAEPAEPSRSADVQHVAVKKLRLDGDTDDTRVLAVSIDSALLRFHRAVLTWRSVAFSCWLTRSLC